MTISYSYGIIPYIFDKTLGDILFLLVYDVAGRNWTFPRGGPQPGESVREGGLRELWEETGLTPTRVLEGYEPLEQRYWFRDRNTSERVDRCLKFHIGEIHPSDREAVVLQVEEVSQYKWCSAEDILWDQNLFENLRGNTHRACEIIRRSNEKVATG